MKFTFYTSKLQTYYSQMNLKKENDIVSMFKWIQFGLLCVLGICLLGWTYLWVQQKKDYKKHGYSFLMALFLLFFGVFYSNLLIQPRPLKIVYQHPLVLMTFLCLPLFLTFAQKINWKYKLSIGSFCFVIGCLLLKTPKEKIGIGRILFNFVASIFIVFGVFLIYTTNTNWVYKPSFWIKLLVPVSVCLNVLQILLFRYMNELIARHAASRVLKNKKEWKEAVDALNALEEYFLIFRSGVVNMLPVRPITNDKYIEAFSNGKKIRNEPSLFFEAMKWQYKNYNKKVLHVELIGNAAGCIILWKENTSSNHKYMDILFRGTRTTEDWARNILGGVNVYSPTDKIGKHSQINMTSHLYLDIIKKYLPSISSPVRMFGHSRGTVIAFMTSLQLLRLNDKLSFYLYLISPPGMFDPNAWSILKEYKHRLHVSSISHQKDIIHQNALLAPFGINMFGDAFLFTKEHKEDQHSSFTYLVKTKSGFTPTIKPFWDLDRNNELSLSQKMHYNALKAGKDPHKILYWKLLLQHS